MLALAPFLLAETFPQAEVKIIGSIDYGQTSQTVHYSSQPRYRAFAFNGRPGEHVEIWVHARHGSPEAFLADNGFQSLAGGKAHFSATIPADSQPATYYIVFRGVKDTPGDFTVELQRPGKPESDK